MDWIMHGNEQRVLVIDFDDGGDHYEGSASALEANPGLPPTFANLTNIPKG